MAKCTQIIYRIFTMPEPICSNSRLSEFRINLFIDNFSSFHISLITFLPGFSSLLIFFCCTLCVYMLRFGSVYPQMFILFLHFDALFRPKCLLLVLIFEWIFIVEFRPHYVFWLQISVLNYAKTGIVLPNFP